MTIPTTIAASGPYLPNGVTTAFPFGFKASSSSDVSVVLVSSSGAEEIVSSAAYDVTLAGGDDPGGTVTMLVAPASDGRELWIYLDPTFLQEIKFEDEGAFNQTILNQLADEAGSRTVWLRERVNRALLLPRSGTALDAVKGKFPFVDTDGAFAWAASSEGLAGAEAIAIVSGAMGATVQASEALAAGDFVNIYSDGGAARMRKATALDPTRFAHGFVRAAVANGASGTARFWGINDQIVVAAAGSDVWLSETVSGSWQTTAPVLDGSIIQRLGVAIPGTGIFFSPAERILL